MVILTVPVGLKKLLDYMESCMSSRAKCLQVGEHDRETIAVMIVYSISRAGQRSQNPEPWML